MLPLSLADACLVVFCPEVNGVDASGGGSVLEENLPCCRLSSSVRVLMEGGGPGGTVEPFTRHEGG